MASVANVASEYAGGDPYTFSLTVSAGTKRTAVAVYMADAVRTFSAVTFNGNAMTEISGASIVHSSTTPIAHMYYYDIPDALGAGSYTVSFDLSSSSADDSAYAWQLAGVVTGGPEDADEVEGATGGSATITRTLTCTDGAVVVAASCNNDPAQTIDWSAGVTERTEGNETNFTTCVADAIIVTGGATVVTATHSSSTGRKLLVTASWAATVGPTISTQPSADTAVISPSEPAVFTVDCAAATTGMQWQDDGTNISGADIGQVDTLANGTSVLTITPTATTRTGSAITCECTDATGMTESSGATLTVRAGVTETATTTTTNASGQTTGTLKTDVRAEGSEMLVSFVALKVNGAELSGTGTGAWFAGLAP